MATCGACGNRLTKVMDFGRMALAGAFLKAEEFANEKTYPLTVQFCEKCLLIQVGEQIPATTLFEHYFYHSSATETMRKHFDELARHLVERFKPESVLEIGANDGVLLRPLQKLGVPRLLGVDPAKNVTPGDLPILNGYWGTEFARAALFGDKFDLVVANNVIAHVEDLNDTCAAIAQTLAPGGAFVFEVNRLDELISGLQYDWVYHEHRYYFSTLALDRLLARHGLELWDAQRLASHGASMRYHAGRPSEHPISRNVKAQLDHERWMGLDQPMIYRRFADASAAHAAELRTLVRREGRVAGYGACGRTNTLLQFAGLDCKDISYIVDDAPAKQGFYTPGTHIPINDAIRLKAEPPDCLLVCAWSFLAEIGPKLGSFPGRVYVPLPNHIYEHRLAA